MVRLFRGLHHRGYVRLRGPSGLEYEAMVRIYWDDQPNGALTVGGSIEDFAWCTYATISEFFTMGPDGEIEGA